MSPNSTSQQPSRAPGSRNTASRLSQYPGLKAAITAAILAISGPAQGEIKKITQIGTGIDKNAERSLVVCDVDPQTLAATCELEANIGDSIPHQAVTEIPGFGQVLVQVFTEMNEGGWHIPSRLVLREPKAKGQIYFDQEVKTIPGLEEMDMTNTLGMSVGAKGENVAISMPNWDGVNQIAFLKVEKNPTTGNLEIKEANLGKNQGSSNADGIEFDDNGAAYSAANHSMFKTQKGPNGTLITETAPLQDGTPGGGISVFSDRIAMLSDLNKIAVVGEDGTAKDNIECFAYLGIPTMGTINGRTVYVSVGAMMDDSGNGVIVIQDPQTKEKKEYMVTGVSSGQKPTVTADGKIVAGKFMATFEGDPLTTSPVVSKYTGPGPENKVNIYENQAKTIVTESEPVVTPPDQNPEQTGSELSQVETQTTEPVTAEPVEQKDAGSKDAGNTQAEEISSGAESPASEPNMAEEVSTGGDAGTSAEVGGGPNDADAGSTAPGGDAGNKLPPSVSADPGCQQGAGQKAPLWTLAGMVTALAALRRRGSKKAA